MDKNSVVDVTKFILTSVDDISRLWTQIQHIVTA